MKQHKQRWIGSSLMVALASTNAFAHSVPGDALQLHHGVTHPGIGITHVMVVALIAAAAWFAGRGLLAGR